MLLSAGEKLGPYELLSPIGEGGMGEVWKARDMRLDRTVAIKVSKADFSDRFESEARAIAALNHPNICQLYDVGSNYLVMELVEGTRLKGPVPVQKAIEYAGQILEALDAAHKKGFTHRDLKPDNILVTRQGVKLLDFGLAKRITALDESDATVTTTGKIVGTLQYMSPEQLQGKQADARSDLFAFGCVLYEMLSGKRAFEGASPASTAAAILEREPPALDLHPPLGQVIKRCLAKDSDERFQTARDLKYNLRLAMDHQPAAVNRTRWPWIAAAALVLGAVGGWAPTRFRPAPDAADAIRLEITPPEGGQFQPDSLAVSPDGSTLAFVARVKNKSMLWIRPLRTGTARLLPGAENAYFPFWSPDGQWIAYFAGNKLWRVDLTGTAPLAICEVGIARGGSWSSSGVIIFATFASGLRRVLASGGSPVTLTVLNETRGEISHFWPQFISERSFLFWVRSAIDGSTGAYVATLEKPQQMERIIGVPDNAMYSAGHLLWRRDSSLVAQPFDPERLKLSGTARPLADSVGRSLGPGKITAAVSAGSREGVLLYSSLYSTSQLTWLDRKGNTLGNLNEPVGDGGFRLSPDGRHAMVSRGNVNGLDLWMVELEHLEDKVWGRFTFLPGISAFPVWSPDSRSVIFRSGTPRNLYRKDARGAGTEERITESGNGQYPTDWSQDGRLLLYYETGKETQSDLWVLPVTPDGKPITGAKPRAYLRTRDNEWSGRFSPEPNPRWLTYVSDETGRDEVYIQAFPEPGAKSQISNGGAHYPQWSPDGRELMFLTFDNKLMTVSVTLGADSVEHSAPRELFGLPGNFFTIESPYALTSDGSRFLVRAVPADAQPLQVIVNWPALLK